MVIRIHVGVAIALGFAACAGGGQAPVTASPAGGAKAHAALQPLGASGVSGNVTFQQESGGVMVEADVVGLAPGSTHGFHIHEVGDCSAPDGSSAGGHFNPTAQSHGAPQASASHVGDLGNLVADSSGKAHLTLSKSSARLAGDSTSLVGRAVIIHQKADDLASQPTGNAGGRVACGVIVAN